MYDFAAVNSSMCLTKGERKSEKLRLYNEAWPVACVCVFDVCLCQCERVLQERIYDTPFTSGGASCLSFFIPLSLMGRWWWREGPSPLVTPPWDEEGPPRPPEECCTLRSLFPSTRICRVSSGALDLGSLIWRGLGSPHCMSSPLYPPPLPLPPRPRGPPPPALFLPSVRLGRVPPPVISSSVGASDQSLSSSLWSDSVSEALDASELVPEGGSAQVKKQWID